MDDQRDLDKGQISLSAIFAGAQSSPIPFSLSLISVLNSDMKFSPHLPPKPKGIGQQDTVSLPQQKTVKQIYLHAHWWEKGREERHDHIFSITPCA